MSERTRAPRHHRGVGAWLAVAIATFVVAALLLAPQSDVAIGDATAGAAEAATDQDRSAEEVLLV